MAALIISGRMGEGSEIITFLTGVEKAKFRKPVRPGDQLVTTAEVLRVRVPWARSAPWDGWTVSWWRRRSTASGRNHAEAEPKGKGGKE